MDPEGHCALFSRSLCPPRPSGVADEPVHCSLRGIKTFLWGWELPPPPHTPAPFLIYPSVASARPEKTLASTFALWAPLGWSCACSVYRVAWTPVLARSRPAVGISFCAVGLTPAAARVRVGGSVSAPLCAFQVTSHTSELEAPSRVTEVVLKLFDSDPITVTIPEEVSRDNPKFMETVAEKALQEYRKKKRVE